jgi:hypothetical protein
LHVNHVTLPEGGIRIILPGAVIIVPERKALIDAPPEAKLRGLSGVVAETLLLNPRRTWKVRTLADESGASVGLTHRVLDRLEQEGIVAYENRTSRSEAFIKEHTKLAHIWSLEAGPLRKPFARAYVYGRTSEDAGRKLSGLLPEACIGGILAANCYTEKLATVPFPISVWLPYRVNHDPSYLKENNIELVEEGANIEFRSIKGDHWRHHISQVGDMKIVSKPRAWLEISKAEGRVHELAVALLEGMK